MKRLFTLLLISFAALSCEMIDEKLDDLLNKRDWVVFADGTQLTVDVPSKQTVLNYKFESTLDWELTTESDWLEIDKTSGKAGKDIKIKIKVLHNKDKEGRTGYVDLTLSNRESYRITINQAGEGDENDENDADFPNNQIWYTSTDGEIVEPYSGENNEYADALTTFGVKIVSNTYKDGKGVITFSGDVTKIGERAFYYCTSLTSVTIPDSVTTIGEWAFYGCDSLTSVTIGDSVTTIGKAAFHGCSSLTSVTIGNSVTSIGVWAFANCTSLTSVTIGNSVTAIGEWAFGYCTSLTSVTIPSSVTEIGVSAFQECTSLTSFYGKFASVDNRCLIANGKLIAFAPAGLTEYTIPDSVTEIGEWAFGHCTSLTNITIPDSVTSIGNNAFEYCTSLTNITIPDSVTEIGEWAFSECYSLASFYGKFASVDNRCLIANGKLIAFAPAGLTEYTIPGSVTEIGGAAFANCYSLTSITIPDSVTTIESSAFAFCYSLTSVTIPDSVTEIGYGAFAFCYSLASVTIGNSVTSIGGQAFQECTSLTSVTIGNSVTSIGNYAFYYCTSLKEVYCKPTTPPIGGYDMFYDNALGRKIYVPAESYYDYICAEGWRDYAEYIVAYDFEKEEVVEVEKPEPGNPDEIENNQIWYTSYGGKVYINRPEAFNAAIVSNICYGDYGVITFDEELTTIGDYAFEACISLTSITIPDSVIEIGGAAFADCTSLTSITIPDSVTEIGDAAFAGCTSLTNITIPDSVTEIRYKAFCYCYSLTNITIPDSVTKIGEGAFHLCKSLTSVTIPDSVTEIGNYAFLACSSLTSFYGKFASVDNRCLIVNGELVAFAPAGLTEYTIPDSVTAIGGDAFSSCESLTSVTIPDSVTSIGYDAFFGCTSLTSVTIPDSVTEIGGRAFHACTSLTSVTIPDSVTKIGTSAFYDCTSLKEVYCKPTTPPTGDYSMFYNNASGRKIYVPMESVEAYKSASGWSEYASDIEGYNF